MAGSTRIAAGTVGYRGLLWLGLLAGFTVLYFGLLLGIMMLRFGALPNYITVYDVAGAYSNILAGTPSWRDVLPILVREPALEIGYRNADFYNIAEWSLMIVPAKAAVVALLSALLATLVLIRRSARGRCRHRGRAPLGVAVLGSSMLGLAMATVTWVVCCAGPTWVVVLAMLGLGSSLALTLQPLGWLMAPIGLALVGGAVYLEAQRAAEAARAPEAAADHSER